MHGSGKVLFPSRWRGFPPAALLQCLWCFWQLIGCNAASQALIHFCPAAPAACQQEAPPPPHPLPPQAIQPVYFMPMHGAACTGAAAPSLGARSVAAAQPAQSHLVALAAAQAERMPAPREESQMQHKQQQEGKCGWFMQLVMEVLEHQWHSVGFPTAGHAASTACLFPTAAPTLVPLTARSVRAPGMRREQPPEAHTPPLVTRAACTVCGGRAAVRCARRGRTSTNSRAPAGGPHFALCVGRLHVRSGTCRVHAPRCMELPTPSLRRCTAMRPPAWPLRPIHCAARLHCWATLQAARSRPLQSASSWR